MSRFDDGAWDEHALMELELRPAAPAEPLAVEAVQARCPQTVDGATFYAHTGNDYHGEFRALQRAWGRGDGSELLGVVEYSHAERRQAHLRTRRRLLVRHARRREQRKRRGRWARACRARGATTGAVAAEGRRPCAAGARSALGV